VASDEHDDPDEVALMLRAPEDALLDDVRRHGPADKARKALEQASRLG
jgi:hypothetical protein